MEITTLDITMMIAIGAAIGGVLKVALYGRGEALKSITKWCLIAGGVSSALVALAMITSISLGPTKGVLGVLFVGLPALGAGLVLLLLGGARGKVRSPSSGGGA